MNEIARHLTSLIDLFRIHLMLCCVPLYKYFASTSCMQIDETFVVTECTSTLSLSLSLSILDHFYCCLCFVVCRFCRKLRNCYNFEFRSTSKSNFAHNRLSQLLKFGYVVSLSFFFFFFSLKQNMRSVNSIQIR